MPPQVFIQPNASLDALADAHAHADGIAGMASGAAINGRAPVRGVLRHMRRDVDLAQFGNEADHVVSLVRAQRDTVAPLQAFQHSQRRLPLGSAGGVGQQGIDDQAVAVLHQQMAHVAELGGLTLRLLIQPGIGIGGRSVGVVAAFLPAEIALGIAARGLRQVATVTSQIELLPVSWTRR